MAKGAYFGVGSTAKKIKKMYIGIGGIARKVKRAYIGIADKARLWFSGGEPEYYKQITLPRLVRNPAATENGDYYMFGTTLGSLPDGPDESVMYLLNSNLTLSSVSPVATKTISSVGRNDKYAFFISVNKDLSSPMVTVYAKSTMEKTAAPNYPQNIGGVCGAYLPDYAVFAGGFPNGDVSATHKSEVYAYSKSLAVTNLEPLGEARSIDSSGYFNGSAVFPGGSYYQRSSSYRWKNSRKVDIYNNSLTKTNAVLYNAARGVHAVSTSEYLICTGGYVTSPASEPIFKMSVYNKSFTISAIDTNGKTATDAKSVSLGDYALISESMADSLNRYKTVLKIDNQLTKSILYEFPTVASASYVPGSQFSFKDYAFMRVTPYVTENGKTEWKPIIEVFSN